MNYIKVMFWEAWLWLKGRKDCDCDLCKRV